MPTRRKAEPHRGRAARLHINHLAIKVARAMSYDLPIVLVLRTRPERRVRGLIESKRIDPQKILRGDDGESNLLVRINGEEIALERIADIRRQPRRR